MSSHRYQARDNHDDVGVVGEESSYLSSAASLESTLLVQERARFEQRSQKVLAILTRKDQEIARLESVVADLNSELKEVDIVSRSVQSRNQNLESQLEQFKQLVGARDKQLEEARHRESELSNALKELQVPTLSSSAPTRIQKNQQSSGSPKSRKQKTQQPHETIERDSEIVRQLRQHIEEQANQIQVLVEEVARMRGRGQVDSTESVANRPLGSIKDNRAASATAMTMGEGEDIDLTQSQHPVSQTHNQDHKQRHEQQQQQQQQSNNVETTRDTDNNDATRMQQKYRNGVVERLQLRVVQLEGLLEAARTTAIEGGTASGRRQPRTLSHPSSSSDEPTTGETAMVAGVQTSAELAKLCNDAKLMKDNENPGIEKVLRQQAEEMVMLRQHTVDLARQCSSLQKQMTQERKQHKLHIGKLERTLRCHREDGTVQLRRLEASIRVLSHKSDLHAQYAVVAANARDLHTQLNHIVSVKDDIQSHYTDAQETIGQLRAQERSLRTSIAQFQRADAYSSIPAISLQLLLPRLALRLERLSTGNNPTHQHQHRSNTTQYNIDRVGCSSNSRDSSDISGSSLDNRHNSRMFVSENPHLATTLPLLHDTAVDLLESQEVQRLLDDLVQSGMRSTTAGVGAANSTPAREASNTNSEPVVAMTTVVEEHRRKEMAQKVFLQFELLSCRMWNAESVCETKEADLARYHEQQNEHEQDMAQQMLKLEQRTAQQLATVARRLGSHLRERHFIQQEKDKALKRNEALVKELHDFKLHSVTQINAEKARLAVLEAQVIKLRGLGNRSKQAKDKLQAELASKAGQAKVLSESLEALQLETRVETDPNSNVNLNLNSNNQSSASARALVLTVQLVNAHRQHEQLEMQIQGMCIDAQKHVTQNMELVATVADLKASLAQTRTRGEASERAQEQIKEELVLAREQSVALTRQLHDIRAEAIDASARARGLTAERDALHIKLQEQISNASSALVEQYDALVKQGVVETEKSSSQTSTPNSSTSNEVLDQFKSVLLDEVRAVVAMAVRGLESKKLKHLGMGALVKLFDKAANMILAVERRRLKIQSDNRALEYQVMHMRSASRTSMELANQRQIALCETHARMRGLEQESTFRTGLLSSYYDARISGLVETLESQRVRYVNATEALTNMQAMRHGLAERVHTVEAIANQCREHAHKLTENMRGHGLKLEEMRSKTYTASGRRQQNRDPIPSSHEPPMWMIDVIERIERSVLDSPQTTRQAQFNLVQELNAAHAANHDLLGQLARVQSVMIQLGTSELSSTTLPVVDNWCKAIRNSFVKEESIMQRTQELLFTGVVAGVGTHEQHMVNLQDQLLQCNKQLEEARFAYDQTNSGDSATTTGDVDSSSLSGNNSVSITKHRSTPRSLNHFHTPQRSSNMNRGNKHSSNNNINNNIINNNDNNNNRHSGNKIGGRNDIRKHNQEDQEEQQQQQQGRDCETVRAQLAMTKDLLKAKTREYDALVKQQNTTMRDMISRDSWDEDRGRIQNRSVANDVSNGQHGSGSDVVRSVVVSVLEERIRVQEEAHNVTQNEWEQERRKYEQQLADMEALTDSVRRQSTRMQTAQDEKRKAEAQVKKLNDMLQNEIYKHKKALNMQMESTDALVNEAIEPLSREVEMLKNQLRMMQQMRTNEIEHGSEQRIANRRNDNTNNNKNNNIDPNTNNPCHECARLEEQLFNIQTRNKQLTIETKTLSRKERAAVDDNISGMTPSQLLKRASATDIETALQHLLVNLEASEAMSAAHRVAKVVNTFCVDDPSRKNGFLNLELDFGGGLGSGCDGGTECALHSQIESLCDELKDAQAQHRKVLEEQHVQGRLADEVRRDFEMRVSEAETLATAHESHAEVLETQIKTLQNKLGLKRTEAQEQGVELVSKDQRSFDLEIELGNKHAEFEQYMCKAENKIQILEENVRDLTAALQETRESAERLTQELEEQQQTAESVRRQQQENEEQQPSKLDETIKRAQQEKQQEQRVRSATAKKTKALEKQLNWIKKEKRVEVKRIKEQFESLKKEWHSPEEWAGLLGKLRAAEKRAKKASAAAVAASSAAAAATAAVAASGSNPNVHSVGAGSGSVLGVQENRAAAHVDGDNTNVISTLQRKLASAHTRLKAAEQELVNMGKQQKEQRAKVIGADALRVRVDELEQTVSNLRSRAQARGRGLESARAQLGKLKLLENEIDSTKHKLSGVEEKLGEAKEKAKRTQTHSAGLAAKLAEEAEDKNTVKQEHDRTVKDLQGTLALLRHKHSESANRAETFGTIMNDLVQERTALADALLRCTNAVTAVGRQLIQNKKVNAAQTRALVNNAGRVSASAAAATADVVVEVEADSLASMLDWSAADAKVFVDSLITATPSSSSSPDTNGYIAGGNRNIETPTKQILTGRKQLEHVRELVGRLMIQGEEQLRRVLARSDDRGAGVSHRNETHNGRSMRAGVGGNGSIGEAGKQSDDVNGKRLVTLLIRAVLVLVANAMSLVD